MENEKLKRILADVASGNMTAEDALLEFKKDPFEDRGFKELGFAKPDIHRSLRQGVPEVIFGEGKSPAQIRDIARTIYKKDGGPVLITRLSAEGAALVSKELSLIYHEICRIGIVGGATAKEAVGNIVVATGGTGDMAVAEEAAITAEVFGNTVTRIYDVGVAGLHRLLAHVPQLMEARVIVAVAGMEGSLPSVISGIVSCPVIAVPTSIGYGANLNGISALLSMLTSCCAGVSVVNIDNGFGAGYLAGKINHMGIGE